MIAKISSWYCLLEHPDLQVDSLCTAADQQYSVRVVIPASWSSTEYQAATHCVVIEDKFSDLDQRMNAIKLCRRSVQAADRFPSYPALGVLVDHDESGKPNPGTTRQLSVSQLPIYYTQHLAHSHYG